MRCFTSNRTRRFTCHFSVDFFRTLPIPVQSSDPGGPTASSGWIPIYVWCREICICTWRDTGTAFERLLWPLLSQRSRATCSRSEAASRKWNFCQRPFCNRSTFEVNEIPVLLWDPREEFLLGLRVGGWPWTSTLQAVSEKTDKWLRSQSMVRFSFVSGSQIMNVTKALTAE
jgi:hypothetical protein